jgi:hypothetical protein
LQKKEVKRKISFMENQFGKTSLCSLGLWNSVYAILEGGELEFLLRLNKWDESLSSFDF